MNKVAALFPFLLAFLILLPSASAAEALYVAPVEDPGDYLERISDENWTVTWYPIHLGPVDKEYVVSVQNMWGVQRDFNLSLLIENTNFNALDIPVSLEEYKVLTGTHWVEDRVFVDSGYWENVTINNETGENVSVWVNTSYTFDNGTSEDYWYRGWKPSKQGIVTRNIHRQYKDDYGLINIPKKGSAPKNVTVNGIKWFRVKFKTPIGIAGGGWGSVGLIGFMVDGVLYHPWFNNSWQYGINYTVNGSCGTHTGNCWVFVNASDSALTNYDPTDRGVCVDSAGSELATIRATDYYYFCNITDDSQNITFYYGNTTDVTVVNATGWYVPSPAIDFLNTGTGSGYTILLSEAMDGSDLTPICLNTWFKAGSWELTLGGNRFFYNNPQFEVRYEDDAATNKLVTYQGCSSGDIQHLVNRQLNLDEWYMFTYTIDTNNMGVVYINDTPWASDNCGGTVNDWSSAIEWGGRTSGSTPDFDGLMTGPKFINRNCTQADVTDIYNAGRTGSPRSELDGSWFGNGSDIYVNYHLDEGSGTLLVDSGYGEGTSNATRTDGLHDWAPGFLFGYPYLDPGSEEMVDTGTPDLAFVSPTPGHNGWTSNDSETINVTCDASAGCDTALLEWGGSNYTMTRQGGGQNTSFYYPLSSVADGTYNYRVYANTSHGYWENTANRTLDVDATPPVVTITTPVNTTYYSVNVSLNYGIVDNNENWTGYSLDGAANVTLGGNITLTGLSDGLHDIIVFSNDSAGSWGSASQYFTVNTSLGITVLSPLNDTYGLSRVWFNITLDTPANWTGYSLDGAANVSLTNSSGNWNGLNTSMSEGPHTVIFYANNSDGNVSTSTQVFTVNTTTGAIITFNSPGNTSYANLSDLTLNVTVDRITNANYSLNGGANVTFMVINSSATATITPIVGLNNVVVYTTVGSGALWFTAENVSIVIHSPANNTVVSSGENVAFNYTPNASYNWGNVSLFFNGVGVASDTSIYSSVPQLIIYTMPSTTGLYPWYLEGCTDEVGCVNSSQFYVNVTEKAPPQDCTASVPGGYTPVLTYNVTVENNYNTDGSLNATIGLILTFTDDNGYETEDSIVYRLAPRGITETLGTATSEGNLSATLSNTPIVPGSITVYADGLANTSWVNATAAVTVSTGGVAVNATGPGNSTSGALITIDYTWDVDNPGNSSITYCLPDERVGEAMDVDITFHNETNYPTRYYHIRGHNTSALLDVTGALIHDDDSSPSVVTLIGSTGAVLQGYIIVQERYEFTNSSYVAMAMCRTSANGECALLVEPNDVYYQFTIWDDDGVVVHVFDAQVITSSTFILRIPPDTISLPGIPGLRFEPEGDVVDPGETTFMFIILENYSTWDSITVVVADTAEKLEMYTLLGATTESLVSGIRIVEFDFDFVGYWCDASVLCTGDSDTIRWRPISIPLNDFGDHVVVKAIAYRSGRRHSFTRAGWFLQSTNDIERFFQSFSAEQKAFMGLIFVVMATSWTAVKYGLTHKQAGYLSIVSMVAVVVIGLWPIPFIVAPITATILLLVGSEIK